MGLKITALSQEHVNHVPIVKLIGKCQVVSRLLVGTVFMYTYIHYYHWIHINSLK